MKLARLIVEQNWPITAAAVRFQVSWPTAKRWSQRYREFGEAGMVDRSSRPYRMPRTTPRPVIRKMVHLRWKQRLGQLEIAARLGVAASTVHQWLRRCGISRVGRVDRVIGSRCAATNTPTPGR